MSSVSKSITLVVDSDNSAIDAFVKTHAEIVKSPADYARQLIIERGERQWGMDIDPDKTRIDTLLFNNEDWSPPPFQATVMHSQTLTQAMLTNWQQNGDGSWVTNASYLRPYRRGGIPMHIVDKLISPTVAYAYEGLYLIRNPQTYDEHTHVNIPAAEFKKFVWDTQLLNRYLDYLKIFWLENKVNYQLLGRASFVRAIFLQVADNSLLEQDKQLALKAAGLAPDQTWEELTLDQLRSFSRVDSAVEVSSLVIHRYTASDILKIKDTRTGRVLLYIPGNSSPIHGFENENSLKDWTGLQCQYGHKIQALEHHFKLKDDSDGIFVSGLHTTLSGLGRYPHPLSYDSGIWSPRDIIHFGPNIVGDPFISLCDRVHEHLASDAASLISTQGEYRKEAIAKAVSNSLVLVGLVAMVAPEAAPLILALSATLIAVGADQVVEARTPEERQTAEGRVVFGVLNALPFVIDKVVRGVVALDDTTEAAEAADASTGKLLNTTLPVTEPEPVVVLTEPATPPTVPIVPPISEIEPPNLRSLRPGLRRALAKLEAPNEAVQGPPTVLGPDGNLNIHVYNDKHFVRIYDKAYQVRPSRSSERWRVTAPDGRAGPYLKPMDNGTWDIADGKLLGGVETDDIPASTLWTKRLRDLYPTLSENELASRLAEFSANDEPINTQIARLEADARDLAYTLDQWVSGPDEELIVNGYIVEILEENKRKVAEAIKRCLQKDVSMAAQALNPRLDGYVLDLAETTFGTLPELSGDFSHVTVINLAHTHVVETSVNMLVQKCPNLRWLSLGGNSLTKLPEGLEDLSQLTRLDLAGNSIVLNEEAAHALAKLTTLKVLNLNDNPVGPLLDVTGLQQLIRLSLRGIGVDTVPEGVLSLSNLTRLDLGENNFVELPEGFFQLSDNTETILDGNPLSEDTFDRLADRNARIAQNAGMSFWLVDTHGADLLKRRSAWTLFSAHEYSSDFFRIINDLRESADFLAAPEIVTERVWEVLEAGALDAALRERLVSIAAHPQTCVDGTTVIFGNMEIEVMVTDAGTKAAEGEQGLALLKLVRGLYRLEQVDQIAGLDVTARVARSPGFEEDVEVQLAYRIGLAQALDLPVHSRTMQFVSVAAVSRESIDAAQRTILGGESEDVIIKYAISREFWSKYLEVEYPEEFLVARRPTEAKMSALDDEHELAPKTDADYKDAVDKIFQQRRDDEQALMWQLTQAELANGPRANTVS